MKIIIKQRLKYCTRKFLKLSKIIAVALILITGIILIKYKPLYEVSINNIKIGYVKNKDEFNSLIKEYTENKEKNIAFITINSEPKYELNLVSNKKDTNEEQILENIKEESIKTYTAYGITLNNDIKTYVDSEENAKEIVNQVNEKYKQNNNNNNNINIGIKQIYTENEIEIEENENAIQKIITIADQTIKEEKSGNDTTLSIINDIKISERPVSGMLTSRYGERSSIRSSIHTGLDIATSSGTPIKACSSGTIIFAEYKGSYGNLVKIDHGNGVETWYGHCSKIYAIEGQKINAGDIIATVGSTGNSTGPHLHLEIRINGESVNPQKYLYK